MDNKNTVVLDLEIYNQFRDFVKTVENDGLVKMKHFAGEFYNDGNRSFRPKIRSYEFLSYSEGYNSLVKINENLETQLIKLNEQSLRQLADRNEFERELKEKLKLEIRLEVTEELSEELAEKTTWGFKRWRNSYDNNELPWQKEKRRY